MSLAKPRPAARRRAKPRRQTAVHHPTTTRSASGTSETGKLVAELKGLAGTRILISPDSRTLFSTDDSGRHIVWDIRAEQRTPQEVAKWLRCYVPFRLDGTKLVSAAANPSRCK